MPFTVKATIKKPGSPDDTHTFLVPDWATALNCSDATLGVLQSGLNQARLDGAPSGKAKMYSIETSVTANSQVICYLNAGGLLDTASQSKFDKAVEQALNQFAHHKTPP
jgi:hypothetical protein